MLHNIQLLPGSFIFFKKSIHFFSCSKERHCSTFHRFFKIRINNPLICLVGNLHMKNVIEFVNQGGLFIRLSDGLNAMPLVTIVSNLFTLVDWWSIFTAPNRPVAGLFTKITSFKFILRNFQGCGRMFIVFIASIEAFATFMKILGNYLLNWVFIFCIIKKGNTGECDY